MHNQGAKALIMGATPFALDALDLDYDMDPTNDLKTPQGCFVCGIPQLDNPMWMDTTSDATTLAAYHDADNWHSRTTQNIADHHGVYFSWGLAQGTVGDVNGDGRFKIGIWGDDGSFGKPCVEAIKAIAMTRVPAARHDMCATAADPTACETPLIETMYYPSTTNADTFDWSSQLTKLLDNHNEDTGMDDGAPDMIASCQLTLAAVAAFKAYKTNGTSVPLLFSAAAQTQQFLSALGDQGEGAMGLSYLPLVGANGDRVKSDILQTTGATQVTWRMSEGYDMAMVFMLATLEAIQANGLMSDPTSVTGAQVRDQVLATSTAGGMDVGTGADEFAKAVNAIAAGQPINYSGASGPVDFDAQGNVKGMVTRWEVHGGQFVYEDNFDCTTDSTCPKIQ